MRLEVAWRKFPKLANYLRHAGPSSTERGAVTVTRRLRQIYRGNFALAGDASGGVDAVTGEGLCLSFRQAIALAHALEEGELQRYQHAHRRLARRPNTVGRLLLLLDRCPSLRRRAPRSGHGSGAFRSTFGSAPGRGFREISGGYEFAPRLAISERLNGEGER